MLDLLHLEQYRENSCLEAKKALGGLPESIWETYSAFANTQGGVILLGVEEYRDRSLHPVDLPDPAGLLQDLWAILNDPYRVSTNLLTDDRVRVKTVEGKQIIVISVPQAKPLQKPVFVGGNPLSGTFLRIGDGDYRCTKEEVLEMLANKK